MRGIMPQDTQGQRDQLSDNMDSESVLPIPLAGVPAVNSACWSPSVNTACWSPFCQYCLLDIIVLPIPLLDIVVLPIPLARHCRSANTACRALSFCQYRLLDICWTYCPSANTACWTYCPSANTACWTLSFYRYRLLVIVHTVFFYAIFSVSAVLSSCCRTLPSPHPIAAASFVAYQVTSFMLGHQPTWACCYCPKKRVCCLTGTPTAASGRGVHEKEEGLAVATALSPSYSSPAAGTRKISPALARAMAMQELHP